MSETYRKHVPPHERSLPEQTLDALLRIEEAMERVLTGLRVIAKGQAKPVITADTDAVKEAASGKQKRQR